MIRITIDIEEHNKRDVRLALEHISYLIEQGYPGGEGWNLEGEEQAYPKEGAQEQAKEDDDGTFDLID